MTQLMYDQALSGPGQSAALTANGLTVRFGGLVAVNRVSFDIPHGRNRQPDRPQRRRQDDVLQRADRPVPTRRGAGDARRPRHHRAAPAQDRRARRGPDLPEHPAVRPDDRRGERQGGDAQPPAVGRVRHHPANALAAPRGEARARRRARAARVRRHSARQPASTRATSPTATSAGWRWPGRWR